MSTKQRQCRTPTWQDPETGDRLVSKEDTCAQLGVTSNTLLRWERRGRTTNGTPFPPRTRLPDGRSFWWQSQINELMKTGLRRGIVPH